MDTAVYDMVLSIHMFKTDAEAHGCRLTKLVMSNQDEAQAMKGLATKAEPYQWQLDSKLGLIICGVPVVFRKLPKYRWLCVYKPITEKDYA